MEASLRTAIASRTAATRVLGAQSEHAGAAIASSAMLESLDAGGAPWKDARLTETKNPWVAVLMGSKTDWDTLLPARELLDELKIPNEVRIISAHRTPDALFEYV